MKTTFYLKSLIVSQYCSTRYGKQHIAVSSSFLVYDSVLLILADQYFSIMKHVAHPAAFAYSMTTLGAAMMNSIFSFYYVKLFLNKYKISEGAFHQSQVSSGVLGFELLKRVCLHF